MGENHGQEIDIYALYAPQGHGTEMVEMDGNGRIGLFACLSDIAEGTVVIFFLHNIGHSRAAV